MCSRLAPASPSSCLILAIACSACAAASPTPTLTDVSRSCPTCPRTNTVRPRATTAWHKSLSSFCSGYVVRVLNLRMRVCMGDSEERTAMLGELLRQWAHGGIAPGDQNESAVLDFVRQRPHHQCAPVIGHVIGRLGRQNAVAKPMSDEAAHHLQRTRA